MSDKFSGSESITLYPGDINVPLVLRFPSASGSTKNDGALPYGSTIISTSALVYYLDDGSSGSTVLLSTDSAEASTNNVVTVWLTHSSDANKGLHSVVATIVCNISGSTRNMTRPFDFDRVWVK